MKKYYSMTGKAKTNKNWVTAYAGKDFDRYALYDLVDDFKNLNNWKELNLEADDGELTDILYSNLPICLVYSEKLKRILEKYTQNVYWLPIKIKQPTKKTTFYFMLFKTLEDVLDERETEYLNNKVLVPSFSSSKLKDTNVFVLNRLRSLLYISEKVKKDINNSNCIGLSFEQIKVKG